jgi:hypothetical protein
LSKLWLSASFVKNIWWEKSSQTVFFKCSRLKELYEWVKIRPIWDRCYDFKNIFAEKFSEKNCRFWLKTRLKYSKFWS